MGIPLRLLLIEDSEADALLLVRELTRAGFEPFVERVQTAQAMRAALDARLWDLVIADYSMPQFSGTAALAVLRERGLDVPFIFVSGTLGEEVAVRAMQAGASDYVLKGDLKRLVPVVERELREAGERRGRRKAEAGMLQSEERLRAILESALDAVVTMDSQGVVTGWTSQAENTFGWSRSEALGRTLSDFLIPPRYREAHRRGLKRFLETGEGPALRKRIEIFALHKDGRELPVELSISPLRLGDAWEFSAFLRDLTAWKQTEAALRELVERAPVGICRSNPAGRFLSANSALARILGYDSPEELLALDLARDVYADSAERQRLLDRDTYTNREYDEVEATWKRKDGIRVTVQLNIRAVRGTAGDVEYYETFVRDVTGQRQLERQLLQAQKMEAVGRLAGGIAHDFNNLLTVILSYSELLLEDAPATGPEREGIEQIRKAADGAGALTRQLLAFSRQQVLEPKVLNINDVVTQTEKLLRRLLGEDVELITSLAEPLGSVRVDPGQLEQVIMNLAVNARDAMPDGGRLSIETENTEMDEAYVRGHPIAQPGPYVMLAMSDTGMGMDEQTKARIFEPFFTTKEPGKGTGLGLATVYGIVRQSGGFIWVYSEPGLGTSFKVYFPRVDEPVSETARSAAPAPSRGSETILVAEDVAAVRAVTRQMLERQGYTVLDAPDGEAALKVAAAHQGTIHLLLTDVVMPGLSGRHLAARLTQLVPGVKVLYMSGYTDDAIVHHGILQPGIAYLQKPFTPDALTRKVRAVLDGPDGGTSGRASDRQ
jgi:two-component system cell cycle sensor histidine kinase/response regulator CckA